MNTSASIDEIVRADRATGRATHDHAAQLVVDALVTPPLRGPNYRARGRAHAVLTCLRRQSTRRGYERVSVCTL